MIILRHLNKTFSRRGNTFNALDDISLHIKAGDIYGVVGESGAGKSTLIRCVNLLERPTSGEVIVDGKNLTQLSYRDLLKARHSMGMIFQHFNLLSNRTVARNISLPLELMRVEKHQIKKRVDELLALTGLTEKAHHYPAQLSGGQKQRVAIARALTGNPKVLLSDEATSALDPKTTDSILALLEEINQKFGVTILLITHEMEIVKKICNHVALIDKGKLVESNTVETFFTQPQSELGQRFVEQIQKFELPELYANKLSAQGKYPVVQFSFQGSEVNAPLLSTLTKRFSVDINIIQARVENIRQITLGIVIGEMIGDERSINDAFTFLTTQPVKAEVLGYVVD